MRITQYLLVVIIYSVLISCANQSSPTGGPKDKDSPELISSVPDNETRNYKETLIEIEFNELIKVENAREQIIITPRIDQEYEIKYKKNKVTLKFEKPLSDSTTYTINFRESIKDLNESNPAQNLKLAFSTGPDLDSLAITGKVQDLLTNQLLDDITVSLYDVRDTLNILNSPPLYFTKTNKQGRFAFENLKSGKYFIRAHKDKNKNLMLDSKSEPHGFIPDTLYLINNIDSLRILTQHIDIRDLQFQGGRLIGTTYQLKYNKGLQQYKINSLTDSIISNYIDKTQQTIQIYNTIDNADSINILIEAVDSINNVTHDTTYIKFEETNRKPSTFDVKYQLKKVLRHELSIECNITFNKPVYSINKDSIYVYLDSLHIYNIDSSYIKFNSYNDIVTITYPLDKSLFEQQSSVVDTAKTSLLKPGESTPKTTNEIKPKTQLKQHIYFGRGAFISIEQDSSQHKSIDLNFVRSNSLGILIVEINTKYPSYIVQLLNNKYETVKEISNTNKFTFKDIEPGEYYIRLLIDSNENGNWDNGNLLTNTPPEPVIFFTNSDGVEKITLRANWEVGPNVITY